MLKKLFLLVVLAGCGGTTVNQPTPDFDVDGLGVKVTSTRPLSWTHAGDLPARIERVASAAAQFAGGRYEDLRGWVVVVQDDRIDCPIGPAGVGAAGCTKAADRTVTLSTMSQGWASCVEQTMLAHEIVHAILSKDGDGDPCHKQALWRDFSPVVQALSGAGCPLGAELWNQVNTCH